MHALPEARKMVTHPGNQTTRATRIAGAVLEVKEAAAARSHEAGGKYGRDQEPSRVGSATARQLFADVWSSDRAALRPLWCENVTQTGATSARRKCPSCAETPRLVAAKLLSRAADEARSETHAKRSDERIAGGHGARLRRGTQSRERRSTHVHSRVREQHQCVGRIRVQRFRMA